MLSRRGLVGFLLAAIAGVFVVGCPRTPPKTNTSKTDNKGASGAAPVFTLAWSEYPSFSVFGVASELGLIDGLAGHQGALEKKWGVDIHLELLEYVPCINNYSSSGCDAVCATNVDILAPAATRKSVAILPTSTSDGADACLVTFDAGFEKKAGKWVLTDKTKALEELKKHKVYGAGKSVSEYVFNRNLQKLGLKPKDYHFTDEEPLPASTAMASKKADHHAIMVWNPFVLEVLDKNADSKRLFDSAVLKEEVIDIVVVAEDALNKAKGADFAHCIIEVYYEVNKKLQGSDQKEVDKILTMLGEKFTTDGATATKLDKMRICVRETKFYQTPDEGIKLFTGTTLPENMKTVAQFTLDAAIVKTETKYAFGEAKSGQDDVKVRFDPSYMQKVKAAQK